jgi:hypothetical protein
VQFAFGIAPLMRFHLGHDLEGKIRQPPHEVGKIAADVACEFGDCDVGDAEQSPYSERQRQMLKNRDLRSPTGGVLWRDFRPSTSRQSR